MNDREPILIQIARGQLVNEIVTALCSNTSEEHNVQFSLEK